MLLLRESASHCGCGSFCVARFCSNVLTFVTPPQKVDVKDDPEPERATPMPKRPAGKKPPPKKSADGTVKKPPPKKAPPPKKKDPAAAAAPAAPAADGEAAEPAPPPAADAAPAAGGADEGEEDFDDMIGDDGIIIYMYMYIYKGDRQIVCIRLVCML